jgi:cysteinyl-tRNA synthetase
VFPHHENERAQAVGGGREFARHWIHHGMVLAAGGEEMHRSAGNYVTLADLLDAHDPRAYRLLVLQSHYRGPMEVNDENLAAAEKALEGLDNLALRAGRVEAAPDPDVLARFRSHMNEDFNTPPALAVIFDAVRRANIALDAKDQATGDSLAAAVRELTEMLGLPLKVSDPVDAESQALATERDEARKAKDWARADALRAQLEALGWSVEDGPDGTRLTR